MTAQVIEGPGKFGKGSPSRLRFGNSGIGVVWDTSHHRSSIRLMFGSAGVSWRVRVRHVVFPAGDGEAFRKWKSTRPCTRKLPPRATPSYGCGGGGNGGYAAWDMPTGHSDEAGTFSPPQRRSGWPSETAVETLARPSHSPLTGDKELRSPEFCTSMIARVESGFMTSPVS